MCRFIPYADFVYCFNMQADYRRNSIFFVLKPTSRFRYWQSTEQQNTTPAPNMHTGVPWAIKLAEIKGQKAVLWL